MHIHILRLVSKVGEQDILLNFDLLKSYVVHVVSSKGIPTLSDHKVAFTHISSTYSLHPNVRTKRGGKAEVKEWAHLEALKLRSLVGALQRLARRTLDAKMHTKMMILKRLFAVQMLWIRDEPERATVDESEDRGHALVPADEADAEDDSERDTIMLGLSPVPLDDLEPRSLEELDMEMHRLICEKTARPEMDDAELEEMLNAACADDEVPDPQSVLTMQQLAELEEMDLERARKDRAPLITDRLELPPELQEMLDEDAEISDAIAGMGNAVKSMQKDVKAKHRHEMMAAKVAKGAGKGRKRKETDETPEGPRRELDDSNSNPMQKKPRTRRGNRGTAIDHDHESKPTETTAEDSAPAPTHAIEAPTPVIEAPVEAPAPTPAIEALVEAPTPALEGAAEGDDGLPAPPAENDRDANEDALRRRRAAERRQLVADTNADIIRGSGIEDLQPPLGFTGKHHVKN
ncbi:unnamed protein product [Symbiodinium sp. CCMP2456]|nr:unnamed protein product [Symbiodinium sp. CCMP2456]